MSETVSTRLQARKLLNFAFITSTRIQTTNGTLGGRAVGGRDAR